MTFITPKLSEVYLGQNRIDLQRHTLLKLHARLSPKIQLKESSNEFLIAITISELEFHAMNLYLKHRHIITWKSVSSENEHRLDTNM